MKILCIFNPVFCSPAAWCVKNTLTQIAMTNVHVSSSAHGIDIHVSYHFPGLVQFLKVTHGADICSKDINHVTPLMEAANGGFLEVVEFLLKIGRLIYRVSKRVSTVKWA